MTEIDIQAVDTVLELIQQQSLYRGEEHKLALTEYRKQLSATQSLSGQELDYYCWLMADKLGIFISRLRNTVIGTLLVDLASGMDLDEAVKAFESKVAPQNYKRPKALITKGMIKKAEAKAVELGIVDSLPRRHAVMSDITINNVLFADRQAKKEMSVFEELSNRAPDDVKKLSKVEEVHIDRFIEEIIPQADSIELMLNNKHVPNLFNLIAPVNADAKHMFKWGNNFSWSYSGEVADSLKERVKAAGGKVDGVLRFSLQWNEGKKDQNIDLDAHAHTPEGDHIYYCQMRGGRGTLDVDNTHPGNQIAVENITWARKSDLSDGEYRFRVHNFSGKACQGGFHAEIEMDGEIHEFSYAQRITGRSFVDVANVIVKDGKMSIKGHMPSSSSMREEWGLITQKFHRVKAVMFSPNYWDEKTVGNKHYFFVLDNCVNDEQTRGFYNEFLTAELNEHRKVFEHLGGQLRVDPAEDQLAGLGFSSTQRNDVLCRVTGAFSRTIKLMF